MTEPPMIFPIVTGSKLPMSKFCTVKCGKSAGVFWIISKNLLPAPYFTQSAIGRKYMLAILCSNPAATKAVIGGMIAIILSVVDRALYVNHTAMQTAALHMIPNMIAWRNPRLVLASPIFNMFKPMAPWPDKIMFPQEYDRNG